MSLTAFLTAAAIHLMPGLPVDRAQAIAEPIAAVTDNREDATLLLVTNYGESSFRWDVQTCKVTGDNGRAMSAYQLHPWLWRTNYGKAWVCADPQWSARLALFALGSKGSARTRIARFMGRAPKDREVNRRTWLVQKVLGLDKAA